MEEEIADWASLAFVAAPFGEHGRLHVVTYLDSLGRELTFDLSRGLILKFERFEAAWAENEAANSGTGAARRIHHKAYIERRDQLIEDLDVIARRRHFVFRAVAESWSALARHFVASQGVICWPTPKLDGEALVSDRDLKIRCGSDDFMAQLYINTKDRGGREIFIAPAHESGELAEPGVTPGIDLARRNLALAVSAPPEGFKPFLGFSAPARERRRLEMLGVKPVGRKKPSSGKPAHLAP
ncbi:MAG: hypothetical protein E6Q76_14485 [Rhizobium sp.]|nr:MAG: hypothetical protein E6Q76_14485 [Rhizobium sp.]